MMLISSSPVSSSSAPRLCLAAGSADEGWRWRWPCACMRPSRERAARCAGSSASAWTDWVRERKELGCRRVRSQAEGVASTPPRARGPPTPQCRRTKETRQTSLVHKRWKRPASQTHLGLTHSTPVVDDGLPLVLGARGSRQHQQQLFHSLPASVPCQPFALQPSQAP